MSMNKQKLKRPILSFTFLSLLLLLITACGTSASAASNQSNTNASASSQQINTGVSPNPLSTQCPTEGKGRIARLPTYTRGMNQNVVYLSNVAQADTTKAQLKRYDVVTKQKTTILTSAKGAISESQVSSEGAWVLFVQKIVEKKRDAIQLVRLDGQVLQTLYCTPSSDNNSNFISDVRWSPDNKFVVFRDWQGSSAPKVKLLDITTGKVTTLWNQADLASLQVAPHSWLNNRYIYVQKSLPFTDARPSGLYVLDITKGANQTEAQLTKVNEIDGTCKNVTSGSGKVFTSKCAQQGTMGEITASGPSFIYANPALGGMPTVLVGPTNDAIIAITRAPTNGLLYIVANTRGDTSNNGIWRTDVDGSTPTKLSNLPQTTASFNDYSHTAWSDVARTEDWYSFVGFSDFSTIHLYIGAYAGGEAVQIAEQNTGWNSVKVVGWTQA